MQFDHLSILRQLVLRDLSQRYRGSFLGIAWAFVLPVLMLVVYTFVFDVIFKQRWSNSVPSSTADFALMLFAGLLVYGFFSDCVMRAPGLIVQNPNYVKKIVFPLEWLPLVAVGSAAVQLAIGLVILAIALLLVRGAMPWTFLLFPFAIAPLALFTVGIVWLLAALGVFLRDIGQITGVALSALLFLSPVFFPVSAAPERIQWILKINPLALPIESARDLLITGKAVFGTGHLLLFLVSVIVFATGLWVFKRLRPYFADVV
jgi:lipopolysaccharide transport system permease protein